MKPLKILVPLLGLLTLLTACGSTPAAAPAPAAPVGPVADETPAASSALLVEDYEDALSTRNQLAFGTLQLRGSQDAVTPEQATRLLPLWLALKALLANSTTAVEESEAVQNQILAAMPSKQVSAIASMRLTNAMLQAYYVEIGVATAATPEPGVTPQSSSFKDLPPEQREAAKATAQALGTPVGNGSGAKKDALLENVIQLLTDRAAGK